jgi:transaldolase
MIYLDSALIAVAQKAQQYGWVKGITTNPTLLAQSPLPPAETLKELAQLTSGELYYQLMATTSAAMVQEGRRAFDLIGSQLVLKIPATEAGFQALPQLAPEIVCSVTAIYSATQAAIAVEGGARYAIAYVNRATRLLGNGLQLIAEMAAVVSHSPTEILAASLKTPEEALQARLAGAHHLTLPWEILQGMTTHPLSLQTQADFNQQGCGIGW